MANRFASLPEPPYYVVVFSSQRTADDSGYASLAESMNSLALKQKGCLGIESARSEDGFGITTAYFSDEAAILAWKLDASHQIAQRLGKERWYEHYEIRVAKVERAYSGP